MCMVGAITRQEISSCSLISLTNYCKLPQWIMASLLILSGKWLHLIGTHLFHNTKWSFKDTMGVLKSIQSAMALTLSLLLILNALWRWCLFLVVVSYWVKVIRLERLYQHLMISITLLRVSCQVTLLFRSSLTHPYHQSHVVIRQVKQQLK